MSLEIVSVWVLRWSESQCQFGHVPTTRCVYLSEKAAKDAREEWIRAIAAQRGVDVDDHRRLTFDADLIFREWHIDDRFALKAKVETTFGEGTRYFLLDDVSGNMVFG